MSCFWWSWMNTKCIGLAVNQPGAPSVGTHSFRSGCNACCVVMQRNLHGRNLRSTAEGVVLRANMTGMVQVTSWNVCMLYMCKWHMECKSVNDKGGMIIDLSSIEAWEASETSSRRRKTSRAGIISNISSSTGLERAPLPQQGFHLMKAAPQCLPPF